MKPRLRCCNDSCGLLPKEIIVVSSPCTQEKKDQSYETNCPGCGNAIARHRRCHGATGGCGSAAKSDEGARQGHVRRVRQDPEGRTPLRSGGGRCGACRS